MTARARRGAAIVALSLSALGCAEGAVTRVVDGETLEGPPIAPEAYAAYAKAELWAAAGNRRAALAELDRALDADPRSPTILSRIGELTCEDPTRESGRRALKSFARALDRDPHHAPAFLGRAECLERMGRTKEALVDAERGAYLDPISLESTRTVARLLFAVGRRSEAWTWLEARAAFEPASPEAAHLVLEAAIREKDPVRAARTRKALGALDGSTSPSLDEALARRDLASARRAALAVRLSGAKLALYSLDRAPELALEQALSTLRADSQDTDAWTAALVAADRVGDERRFAEILPLLDAEPLAPSPRALALLSELIARRAGPDAARALAAAR